MASTGGVMDEIVTNLSNILSNPGRFIDPGASDISVSKKHTKVLYDSAQNLSSGISNQDTTSVPVLNELYVDNFDAEQIWQQIDHRLTCVTQQSYVATISKLLTADELSLQIDLPLSTAQKKASNGVVELEDDDEDDEDEEYEQMSDNESEGESDGEEAGEFSETDPSDDEDYENKNGTVENKKKASRVDDDFFSLKNMEKFLDQQDALLEKDPVMFDRQLDEMYESDDSSDPGYKHEDFFGKQSDSKLEKKSATDESFTFDADDAEDDELSDEELELMKALDEETAGQSDSDGGNDDNDNEDNENGSGSDDGDESDAEHLEDVVGKKKFELPKSEYEKRQDKLKERIAAMEEAALEDKPWQLMGEATSRTRPENSLLQEVVEFDSNVAPVPMITAETTVTLEQLILQRIKDKAFDDVLRKTRLKEDSEKYRNRIELDQEKSKLSLSQIYEQEYLKLRDKDEEKEEQEDPEEKAIQDMMSSLFSKLDALSNFQYTPKPAPKEAKIVSRLPALVVEEVQPDTVADAARLAPEEIKKPRVAVKDRSELDTTDKKRIRRQKKAKTRKVEKFKKTVETRVRKINPGLGNKRAEQRSIEAIKQAVVNEGRLIKPTKESVMSDKVYSSSKEFFKALQNEVKLDKQITRKKADAKKWVIKKSGIPAERLKL